MTSHLRIFRFAASIGAAFWLACSVTAGDAWALGSDAVRLRQAIESGARQTHFMGAVLVSEGDKILIDRAYGSANLEWKLANSPRTKFRIGSLTKQFTGAAVLLLEERGVLKLGDKVSAHLSGLPTAWIDVTIQQLLNHTAGIPSFTDLPSYATLKLQSLTPTQILAEASHLPLESAPGERFKYSNSGYVLLGQLIEKLSGQGYAEFMATNIFKPLGMSNTSVESNSALLPERAAGYRPTSDKPGDFARADFIDMTIPHAAGAIVSTTHDLHRWQQGLFGGKLLTAASLVKMTTPALGDYGLGLLVTKPGIGASRLMYHGGGIDGFNAWLQYEEPERRTIVVLSNVEGGSAERLAARLAAAGKPPPPFATEPFFLRGSMNEWSQGDRLRPSGPKRWSVELELSAGKHELKIASEDWKRIDLGSGEQAELRMGNALLVESVGGNLVLNAPKAGRYRFSLDVRAANAPKLIVTALH